MKILHLNSYYVTTPLYTQFFNRQINNGLDIDVYVPVNRHYSDVQLPSFENYVTVSKAFNTLQRAFLPFKIKAIWKDLMTSKDISSYDLIHAHSLFSNGTIAYKIWEHNQTPYLVAIRSADVQTFFEKFPLYRRLGIQVLKHAKKIIFISKAYYDRVFDQFIPKRYVADFKSKSVIIGNGINDEWHENLAKFPKSSIHKPLRVVSVGKLLPGKQHVLLAKLLEKYQSQYGPVELHIVGPKSNNKVYRSLLREKIVTYHGSKNIQELIEFYRKMDVFALLSSRETFGLVYPEAMSQGLPVMYTKEEGFDGVFPDKYIGVSTSYKDQYQFNEALNYILDHYQELSNNALKELSHFNWDGIVSQYTSIYQELIKEGVT